MARRREIFELPLNLAKLEKERAILDEFRKKFSEDLDVLIANRLLVPECKGHKFLNVMASVLEGRKCEMIRYAQNAQLAESFPRHFMLRNNRLLNRR